MGNTVRVLIRQRLIEKKVLRIFVRHCKRSFVQPSLALIERKDSPHISCDLLRAVCVAAIGFE